MSLLTDSQKNVVASVLALIVDHPDFASDEKKIVIAISKLTQIAG